MRRGKQTVWDRLGAEGRCAPRLWSYFGPIPEIRSRRMSQGRDLQAGNRESKGSGYPGGKAMAKLP